eukprot:COSAG06_NODE_10572_length_1656_cov_58.298651_2_plen_188_part_00
MIVQVEEEGEARPDAMVKRGVSPPRPGGDEASAKKLKEGRPSGGSGERSGSANIGGAVADTPPGVTVSGDNEGTMVKRGVSPSRPDGGAGAAKKPKGPKPRTSKAARDNKNGMCGLERMLAAHGLPENGDLGRRDNTVRDRRATRRGGVRFATSRAHTRRPRAYAACSVIATPRLRFVIVLAAAAPA